MTNSLVYIFNGKVIYDAMNYPGCMHNCKLAYLSELMFLKLSNDRTLSEMAILVDSAFVVNGKTGAGMVV